MSVLREVSEEPTRERAETYELLGRLVRCGLHEADLAAVGRVEVLGRVVRRPWDPDREGAAHYALFGYEVFPWESVFCAASGQSGGATTAAVADRYVAAGFAPDTASEEADHLGHELAFLGYLSRREGAAAEAAACDFLDAHVLRWLPALVVAVRRRGDAFWTAVADLALEVAVAHRAALGPRSAVWPEPVAETDAVERLLGDPATRLADIARFLLRPASSGLLLTRADLTALGRRVRVPQGFGGREARLTALLQGAAEYDRLGELMAALDAVVVEWARGLEEVLPPGPPPLNGVEGETLGGRLDATRALLSRLAEGAHARRPTP